MASDNIFKEDEATKDMILEISSCFGVKADIVRQVWQFTVFSIMLRVAKSDESKLTRFTIPYIGNIGIRSNGTIATSDGNMEPDLECFLSISDTFKNLFSKAIGGNYGDLSNFLQKKYIEPVVNNINQQ